MRKIIVIGAGQLGSRHIQALKAVAEPLSISVVDPSEDSLKLTQQRYEQVVASHVNHKIEYLSEMPTEISSPIDLAIIACSSDVRFKALEMLLNRSQVKHVILEKVLFAEPQQYHDALALIQKIPTKVFVNCCMRELETYRSILASVKNTGPIHYYVAASNFGLLSNSIHYVDHMCHVLQCEKFKVDVSGLDSKMIESKRPGFKDATGQLGIRFEDGSSAKFINFATGSIPIAVEISSSTERYIVKEVGGGVWHSGASTNSRWVEIDSNITPQSILTTEIAEKIFKTGECLLPSLQESTAIHLSLYEPIRQHFGLQSYLWT